MSKKTKTYDANTISAYYAGLRTAGDPETLADIGIPMDPDELDSDIKSGREVGERLRHIRESVGTLAVFCADCLDDVQPGSSCGHLGLDARGKITIIG